MENLVVILAVIVACCNAQFSGFSLNHPSAKAELNEWVGIGTPDRSEKVEVTFAIKQTGLERLEQMLMDVSSPRSPNYGNYMTFKEIAEVVYAREESVAAVLQMLKSAGVDEGAVSFTPAKEYATVKIPVSAVEELFKAEMKIFEREGKQLTRSKKFNMPESIRDHVDFVSGVDHFPPASVVGLNQSSIPQGSEYVQFVNPEVIDMEYNIDGYVATNRKTTQAIASFVWQYYSPEDLRLFQEKYNVPINPISETLGYNNKRFPGTEATLDVEYVTGVGKSVTTWVEYVPDGFVESWTRLILTLGELAPLVHSISYGMPEAMYPPNYLDRTNQDLMKIALSGRTVLVASGDNGVGCYNRTQYMPEFPSSSPYVTTVGGTVRTTAGSVTWPRSGGGFSNHFRMPRYQKGVVMDYLLGDSVPPFNFFNMSGRAYPDVSAYALGCEIIWQMLNETSGGTSCSSPIIAGVVSLLNDVRLNNGMKPLGFLNPLLYEALQGRGMIDITMGSNWIDFDCGGGFKAVPGWDPATGWGSPDFSQLKTYAMQYK